MFIKSYKDTTKEQGFTLVEIAIAIVVIGLLITPLFSLYSNYLIEKQVRTTNENIDNIVSQLEIYRNLTGAYPCPAPMTVARTDANNGVNLSCDTAVTLAALSYGDCVNGICVEEAPNGNSDVIVGTVPFRALQMNEDQALDAYGNRLLYVVTESATDINTFDQGEGSISVVNSAGQAMTKNDDALFLVMSYGKTEYGAYSKNGLLKRACPATTAIEYQNCNPGFASGSSPQTQAVYTYSPISKVEDDSLFDDIMAFSAPQGEMLWKRLTADPDQVHDLSPNNIGIGEENPSDELVISTASTPSESVIINDEGAALITEEVCDETGTYCFEPALIAGDPDVANTASNYGGMRCPDGTYLVGIDGSSPICEPHRIECPDTSPVFRGLDSDGDPICSVIPGTSCPAQDITVCSSVKSGKKSKFEFTVPRADGYKETNIAFGDCAKASVTCDDGTWKLTSSSTLRSAARCDFVPGPDVVETGKDCGSNSLYGTSTYTITKTPKCGGGYNISSTCNSECECGKDSSGVSLPPFYKGTTCKARDSKWKFNTALSKHVDPNDASKEYEVMRKCSYKKHSSRNCWSNGTNRSDKCYQSCTSWDTSKCICDAPATTTRWVNAGACGGFMTGDIFKEQIYDSSVGQCKWKDTGNIDNSACTCVEPIPNAKDNPIGSCSGSFTGTIYQPVIFDLGTCTWKNNGAAYDTCSCTKPASKDEDYDANCSALGHDTACYKPDSSDKATWNFLLNSTTCEYDLGHTVTNTGSCEKRKFYWKVEGSSGTVTSKGARRINKPCDCNDYKDTTLDGSTKVCYSDTDMVQYNCSCVPN